MCSLYIVTSFQSVQYAKGETKNSSTMKKLDKPYFTRWSRQVMLIVCTHPWQSASLTQFLTQTRPRTDLLKGLVILLMGSDCILHLTQLLLSPWYQKHSSGPRIPNVIRPGLGAPLCGLLMWGLVPAGSGHEASTSSFRWLFSCSLFSNISGVFLGRVLWIPGGLECSTPEFA